MLASLLAGLRVLPAALLREYQLLKEHFFRPIGLAMFEKSCKKGATMGILEKANPMKGCMILFVEEKNERVS